MIGGPVGVSKLCFWAKDLAETQVSYVRNKHDAYSNLRRSVIGLKHGSRALFLGECCSLRLRYGVVTARMPYCAVVMANMSLLQATSVISDPVAWRPRGFRKDFARRNIGYSPFIVTRNCLLSHGNGSLAVGSEWQDKWR